MTAYNLGTLAADIVFLVVVVGVVAGIVFLVKAKSTAADQTTAGPNWYPDPVDPEVLRFFDGENWTGATQPRAVPPGS